MSVPPSYSMTPLNCCFQICKKTFKRPQDLKKHEKIHTEEHHAQHRHSKAVTIPDTLSRTRREPVDDHGSRFSSRSKLQPGHLTDGNCVLQVFLFLLTCPLANHFGPLPTPSPEVTHLHVCPCSYSLQDSHGLQDTIANLGGSSSGCLFNTVHRH